MNNSLNCKKDKYRIVQTAVHSFDIQVRLFGLFWFTVGEYPSYSLEDARNTIEAWEANRAVSGQVYEP